MNWAAMNPRYPVYVISKGRADNLITPRYLAKMSVPFSLVIEPQEQGAYARAMAGAGIDPGHLLILPFRNLGQGSIPARNWVWDHALAGGHARHWILDDNIQGFYRYHGNIKRHVWTGAIFAAAEDFTDRYLNVRLSGFQYEMFVPRRKAWPPFYVNTRIYSCILIDNACRHRWRGRYNEDTDLSIRVLKDGDCTILFNAFLANKIATMTCKGGNTDELYRQDDQFDGRLEMARSLQRQHPDIVKITRKWGRWQHHVDYRPFKGNKLIRRPDLSIPQGIDNYGMVLARPDDS
jgi:hypothetical protein